MSDKRIVLAIDTGFDGGKICVNDNLINIPFMIQDISSDEEGYALRRIDDSFIRCIKDGKTYLLGEVARTFLLNDSRRENRRSDMEVFYTLDRFNMPQFEVALDAFIAYGLYCYQDISAKDKDLETFKLSEINDWDIYVGVALPHQFIDKYIPVVESYLKKEQNLKLIVGMDETGDIKYQIKETFYNSQVICALINEAVDDDGNDREDSPYDNLPALILDGGYKTFGYFEFARDESITNDASNIDYAMKNINDRVAAILSEKTGTAYTDYMVDELALKHECVRYLNGDKVESIDVAAEKEIILEEISKKLIDHLNEKYRNLLDIKMILVAGGTGYAYYKYIKEYCEKERPYIKVVLACKDGFKGKECNPVYAVVCGLYKDMLMQLDVTA